METILWACLWGIIQMMLAVIGRPILNVGSAMLHRHPDLNKKVTEGNTMGPPGSGSCHQDFPTMEYILELQAKRILHPPSCFFHSNKQRKHPEQFHHPTKFSGSVYHVRSSLPQALVT